MRSLVMALLVCAWTASAAQASEALWETLQMPGSVVVLRHSHAPGVHDPVDVKVDDCTTQRNLDEEGRAQAKRIGEAFRAHGISVGEVRSSPFCRCVDTAKLAFGKAEPWRVLVGSLDPNERQREIAEIRKAIAEHRDGPPLVLVTHTQVVSDLTGLNVPMGGFVVFHRTQWGFHSVAGQLLVE